MPFRLRNAPGTFQKRIDLILSTVKWQLALVYLNDIAIFSKTPERHINHVRTVLAILRGTGVTLELQKYAFFTSSITYLRHFIRPHRSEICSHTLEEIWNLNPLTNITELNSFFYIYGVLQSFVPNSAPIAAPLNKKLRKDQPTNLGQLTSEEHDAVCKVHKVLFSPPVLQLLGRNGHFTIEKDAWNVQVGCMLFQKQLDGTKRRIRYWSRFLNAVQRAYGETHSEGYAVIWAMLLLRLYIEGKWCTFSTDHDSVKGMMKLANATGMIARWRLRLSESDFYIVHTAGIKNEASNALCRLEGQEWTTMTWTTTFPSIS